MNVLTNAAAWHDPRKLPNLNRMPKVKIVMNEGT